MHNFTRSICSSFILCAAALAAPVGPISNEAWLVYEVTITEPPAPVLATNYDKELKFHLDRGLPLELAKETARAVTDEMALVAKGRTRSCILQALVFKEGVSIRKSPMEKADFKDLMDNQATEEVMAESTYGYFYGSQADVPKLASGSIQPLDFSANDAKLKAPNHWLPHTIGHRLALALIGQASLQDLLKEAKLLDKSEGKTRYSEGDYIWEISATDSGPFSHVQWLKKTQSDESRQELSVTKWTVLGSRKTAAEFEIINYDSKGGRGIVRNYKLVKQSHSKEPGYKRPFEVWPNPTLVVDSRTSKPSTYWMKGELLSIAEAEKHPIRHKPRKTSMPYDPWPHIAFGGLVVFFAAGSLILYSAKKRKAL